MTANRHIVHFCGSIKNKSIIFLVFVALCGLLYCLMEESSAADSKVEEILIIGNKKLPFDSLSRNELKDIFHCRKTMGNDSRQIEMAVLRNSRIHQQFVRYYILEKSRQYRSDLKNISLFDEGCQRMTFRSEKSVLSHVALTDGTIGYISSYTKPEGVKVIKIIEKQ